MIQFIEIEQENSKPALLGVARIEMVAPGSGENTKIWFAGDEQPLVTPISYDDFCRRLFGQQTPNWEEINS